MSIFAEIDTTETNSTQSANSESDTLTRPQRATLEGLKAAIEHHGNPSLSEIAKCASDYAHDTGRRYYASTVHKYLRELEAKGYVRLGKRLRTRSIRLIKKDEQ